MPILADIKSYFFSEEMRYKAGISQNTGFKIGRSINFLLHTQHLERSILLNGPYYLGSSPQVGVDGPIIFDFDIEIFNVRIFNWVAGTSGTTEFDLKKILTPGGSGTSIFSTTPKITSVASSKVWCGVGDTVTGCTAPILTGSLVNVDEGQALELTKVQAMAGAQDSGLIIYYRPR